MTVFTLKLPLESLWIITPGHEFFQISSNERLRSANKAAPTTIAIIGNPFVGLESVTGICLILSEDNLREDATSPAKGAGVSH